MPVWSARRQMIPAAGARTRRVRRKQQQHLRGLLDGLREAADGHALGLEVAHLLRHAAGPARVSPLTRSHTHCSVLMNPGHTALTRMPCSIHSMAMHFIRPETALFELL